MSSEVDIVNLALSHLGDAAEVEAIDPPDGTAQAGHASRFYPIARGVLLEMHPWTFATKRVAVSEVDNVFEDDWAYAYALPSTCLRPLTALYPGVAARAFSNSTDAEGFPYIVEAAEDGTAVLYTNVETAVLRYIDLITDTTKYTPLFVSCLSRLLASYLAGPVIKGAEGSKAAGMQLKIFEVEFAKAAAMNANVGKRTGYQNFRPGHLAGRGAVVLPEGYVDRSE
jgi:hypothetical protein